MVFTCSTEKWKKMNSPDLNSIIFLRDRKTSKKVYFIVVGIDYGFKGGVKLLLQKLKKTTKKGAF